MSKDIAIVGSGLAGTVLAMFLAQKGMKVQIFEKNEDPRTSLVSNRSINLTLTQRGINAFISLGIHDLVLQHATPVIKRMSHLNESITTSMYSEHNDALYSINRMTLNKVLLDILWDRYQTKPTFAHRCVGGNIKERSLIFEDKASIKKAHKFSTIFGTDGVFSSIRQLMQESTPFESTLSESDHCNLELTIPSHSNLGLSQDALHVWPHEDFMLIAFPNPDGSFTCTLQLPKDGPHSQEELRKTNSIRQFMCAYFKEIEPFMSNYEAKIMNEQAHPMYSMKSPVWNIKGLACLLGDSAHAVFPSLGQGANCAFEDCLFISSLLDKFSKNFEKTFEAFFIMRKKSADALNTLSNEHYLTLRSKQLLANENQYKKQRKNLQELCPEIGNNIYSSIAFSKESYLHIAKRERIVRNFLRTSPSFVSTIDVASLAKLKLELSRLSAHQAELHAIAI